MYQAWQQGNSQHVADWMEFVTFAARQNSITVEQMLKELERCKWFKRVP